MAPIKELEAPAASAPQSKSPNNSATHPQPIALEIPVTVNGARTVDGSDKRIPFSESTQTVLVFPHGAVIRVATPLAAGQLVFLTNEKSKKEVVCQVVKSKSTGNAGAYVEVQFTEPAPGFWGAQVPAAPVASAPARSATPVPNPTPNPVAPAIKPPVAAKPTPVAPPKPAIVPPPAPVAERPQPVNNSAPAVTAPRDPAAADSALNVSKLSPVVPHEPAPMPPLRDYSKQIDVLFRPTQPPPAAPVPESSAPPAATQPSTDDLKQQAARLQAQLSSLLFTETPKPSAPQLSPIPPKVEAPVAEVAKKILEISNEEAKQAAEIEPRPVPPSKKAVAPSLGEDEEVKIPAWLAPLSQNQNLETETSNTASTNQTTGDLAASIASEESLGSESSHRSQTAVFGGQLLGEIDTTSAGISSGSSKKGLFFGLVAAAALLAGGWYYYQGRSHSSTVVAAHSTNLPAADLPAATPPVVPEVSTPAASSKTPSSSATPTQPAKNSSNPAAPPATPVVRNNGGSHKEPEPVEEAAKPTLGDVHLAAPVVNRKAESHSDTDASLSAIDTKAVPSSVDPFGAPRHNVPAAPLPVGGDVKSAELIKSVAPEYPSIAKTQRVSGKVQVDALIDSAGNVASAKVLSGPALLHRAALDAVKQWKYKPALLNGEPTSMHLTVTVDFKAQ